MRFAIATLVPLLLVGADLHAQQALLAVDSVGRTWTIDAANGTSMLLGATGVAAPEGMTALHDRYYVAGGGAGVHELDLATGASLGLVHGSSLLSSIRALAHDAKGRLWCIENGGGPSSTTAPDLIMRIDGVTGAATAAGTTAPFTRVEGLAFGPGGSLYGWDLGAGLVRIDPVTGVTTDVNPAIGAPLYLRSLAWSPRGVMFGAGLQLATIDLVTGAVTQVGSTTLLDIRGLEVVDSDVVLDNGPVRTHRTLGAGGKDLSMLQTGLGLTAFGFAADVAAAASVLDEFQTDGPVTLEGVDLFAWERFATTSSLTAVHLAIHDGSPGTILSPIAGSPAFTQNLIAAPGYTVTVAMTDTFRAADTSPLDGQRRLQRVSVRFATPLLLDSTQTATGAYWLQVAFAGSTAAGPFVAPVTTVGLVATGNALHRVGAATQPMQDVGSHAVPFVLRGTRAAPPGGVQRLPGACVAGILALDVSGATVAGGTVVHRLVGGAGIPGFVFGVTQIDLPLLPCPCVLRPNMDFLVVGTNRHDLVVPPGLGTGFEYSVQCFDLDPVGGPGFACGAMPSLRFSLSEAARVRLW